VTATYRLQLHRGFTFADARERVPYLAALGISHLYLSPVLQPVPGSLHGYDVLDHTRLSDDLGGLEGFERLAATVREHGLGIIVDVVPNHMAFVAPEDANAPLWQVLAEGRDAATAHWFDIDWKAGGGRIGLPLLGGTLAEVLDAGELVLEDRDGGQVVRYHDHVFPVALGTEGDDVAEVLQRQHYQLASWRDTDTMLNYRRFFDVATLIAVRVELPDVFEATHRLLLDLNRRGLVEGFRIDHPDGLADPEEYLRQLRAAAVPGTGIWVEKILEGSERLPESWACDGTTGYDALRAVSVALTDPEAAPVLDQTWLDAGGNPDVEYSVARAKRAVVQEILAPEVHRLTRRAREALPDDDPARLEAAVVELLVAGEVYRAYVHPEARLSPLARRRLQHAFDEAVGTRPDLRPELERLLGLATVEHNQDGPAVDFAVRLQQTWGPVMAKGIEDTTFYRWHRLVALNEVGGDPSVLETASPEALHRWAEHQQAHWPMGLTTLSTHDTKRSEDVRARLLAVSADTESWQRCSKLFAEAAEADGLDRPTAHLVWQTLVGVGPVPAERLHGYLVKAVREAKRRTAWVDGDPDYEARVLAFADRATAPGPLQGAVAAAVAQNAEPIRATILGAKLLQQLLPGVPDTYQGCELVDLSLVDPDNRRPVDFDERAARLARLEREGPVDLDDEKLLVTTRALRVRRELPDELGAHGGYAPLATTSEHALGYLRGRRVACVVTRAAHRLAARGGWRDEAVTLPAPRPGDTDDAPTGWRDELTGRLHPGGDVRCADLFATMPVALLVAR
jgi:(1->4)-alpha-D-glucan 1-alpha-D-glucosylmutase